MTSSIVLDNLASVDYKLIRQLGIAQIAKMYPAIEIVSDSIIISIIAPHLFALWLWDLSTYMSLALL